MFWRKAKSSFKKPFAVAELAGKLGVERRYAVRIRYPQMDSPILPAVYYGTQKLQMFDISEGGCCLLDQSEVLGPSIGQDVHLVMHWPGGRNSVHARIVSRVDDKRHIQFLNLPQARATQLQTAIAFGTKAQSMRSTLETVDRGPALAAREVWSSVHGHSVVIEDHIHRLAQILIGDAQYTLYKRAWPVKNVSTPLTVEELGGLIVFLCNIPQASELLCALIAHVELMSPSDYEGAGE